MWNGFNSILDNDRHVSAASQTDTRSDRDVTDDDDCSDDGDAEGSGQEVTALCWSGGSVGVARFLCAECRIEVFEAPVCMVAGEAVRRPRGGPLFSVAGAADRSATRRQNSGIAGSEGEVRILVYEDIPPSLLWLVRYLEVHRPQVLLPHTGSEALHDLVDLVSARTPVEVIRLSATSAFNAAEALRRLAMMYPAQEAELAMRFHVEKASMMRAMAALLQFVAAVQSNVADVVERGVLHALFLEDTCAEALQITRTERHPSSGQGRGRAKEGLSLRGLLLHATQSSFGKAMLRQWMALPCCDIAEIEARQSAVAFFAHVERHGIAAQLRTALHKVRSTSHIFTSMRLGRMLPRHYQSLYRTISGMLAVHTLLETVAHEVDRVYVLLQSVAAEPLRSMADVLARTIDGVAAARCSGGRSAVQNRVAEEAVTTTPVESQRVSSAGAGGVPVHVCDGVDAVLDELRLRLHELRLSLQAKAEAAFAELPWELRCRLSLRCVYAPPHGYLLCIPVAELHEVLEADGCHRDSAGSRAWEADVAVGEASVSDDCSVPGEEEEADSLEDDAVPAAHSSAPTPADADASTGTEHERICACMANAFAWQLHHVAESGEFCFKSSAMEALDVWVGDLQRRVQQREQQVRRELDTTLLYNSLHLLRPTRALGELDCLLSFARVSAREGWCRPDMVTSEDRDDLHQKPHTNGSQDVTEESEDGVLEIEDGWHPLLSRQLGMQQLVPFTVQLRTSTDRACLILGVNGSGKSVLMSAIAQIVFLAHVGCHVPAAAARMSLVNSIFAPSSLSVSARTTAGVVPLAALGGSGSIGPRSACWGGDGTVVAAAAARAEAEAAQCSFHGECVALHRALHHVAGQRRVSVRTAGGGAAEADDDAGRHVDHTAGRALMLLDEFGRGTAPEDGCALLKATLRFFATGGADEAEQDAAAADEDACAATRSRWRRAPFVLCATHLVEILDLRSSAPLPRENGRAVTSRGGGSSRALARERAGADEAIAVAAAASVADSAVADCDPSTRRQLPCAAEQRLADLSLPLQWVKVYEMESHTTYGVLPSAAGKQGGTVHDRSDGPSSCTPRLPLDVTPTYQPICVTSHPGRRRWEDWRHHSSCALLDAGPALGRQCGLDADLLACWEAALQVLHGLT